MSRKDETCPTGWAQDTLEQQVGLFTLYQSACRQQTRSRNSYQPVKQPLMKILPQLQNFSALDKTRKKEEKASPAKIFFDPKLIFKNRASNKKSLKSRSSKEKQKSEVLVNKKVEQKVKKREKAVRIKTYGFMEEEMLKTGDKSDKTFSKYQQFEGTTVRKRLCVKQQLEKIIKNRRKNPQNIKGNGLIRVDRPQYLPLQRYNTLDSYNLKQKSRQLSQGTSKESRSNKYLDCAIINLSPRNSRSNDKYNTLHDNPSSETKKMKKMDKKRLKYRSNLLLEYENKKDGSFEDIVQEERTKNNKFKEVVKSCLKNHGTSNSLSEKKLAILQSK